MTYTRNDEYRYAQLALALEQLPQHWRIPGPRRFTSPLDALLPSVHDLEHQHNQVWELVPFDADAHNVSDLQPSHVLIDGCGCPSCGYLRTQLREGRLCVRIRIAM